MVQLPPPRDGRLPTTTGRELPTPPGDLSLLLSTPNAERGEDFVRAVLAGAREFLDMDVAFIGEFTAGERVFRYVDNTSGCPVRVGGADPLETTYCQRVVDGRLPELIDDAATLPAAAGLAVTRNCRSGPI